MGLRPTGNRIRETLFNWLAPYIEGATCLDLFAGSGALSFEALSRGAKSCTALDNNPAVIAQLKANQSQLKASNLQILGADSRNYLQHTEAREQFDIVFMDPPFATTLHHEISLLLTNNLWLSPGALIYSELPVSEPSLAMPNWQLLKEKTAGEVKYCLHQYVELSA